MTKKYLVIKRKYTIAKRCPDLIPIAICDTATEAFDKAAKIKYGDFIEVKADWPDEFYKAKYTGKWYRISNIPDFKMYDATKEEIDDWNEYQEKYFGENYEKRRKNR